MTDLDETSKVCFHLILQKPFKNMCPCPRCLQQGTVEHISGARPAEQAAVALGGPRALPELLLCPRGKRQLGQNVGCVESLCNTALGTWDSVCQSVYVWALPGAGTGVRQRSGFSLQKASLKASLGC